MTTQAEFSAFNIEEAIATFFGGVVFDGVEAMPDTDQTVGTSANGLPVYDQLSFLPKSYKNKKGETIQLEGFQFPSTVLIHARIVKLEVEGYTDGLNGKHIEAEGLDDYEITIQGMCISHDSKNYPAELVTQLNDYFRHLTTHKVSCKALNRLGIYEIRLAELSLPPYAGFRHAQPFEILAHSVEQYALEAFK